ncbi:MAG: hypothetical protein AB1589_14405 [Cyanobacteriota bacterium]
MSQSANHYSILKAIAKKKLGVQNSELGTHNSKLEALQSAIWTVDTGSSNTARISSNSSPPAPPSPLVFQATLLLTEQYCGLIPLPERPKPYLLSPKHLS